MKNISRLILNGAQKSNLCWCILRKEDEIIAGIENDIDIFVSSCDYHSFLKHLREYFFEHNLVILRERRMPAGTSYLLGQLTFPFETEKLDIIYENTLTFISIISSDLIIQNIVPGESYPVLSAEVSADLSVRKERARSSISNYVSYLVSDLKSGRGWPKLVPFRYLKAFLFNSRKPSGVFVVLVGPDGSGKTTVAESLIRKGKNSFFSVSLFHFSIPTFPRLAKLLGRGSREPDYTLPNSGTSAPIQSKSRALIYTIYYGLELFFYSHLRLRRRLRQGELVIFDRYLHDWMFQRSYRNMSRPAIRWLLSRSVSPELVVYLTGNPVEINFRKPELSVSEISYQQTLIESDLMPFWEGRGVTTVKLSSTALTVDEIVKMILNKLTRNIHE